MSEIKLRALNSDDMPVTLKWHNQDNILNNYSGHPFPVNFEMEKKWYDKILISNFPTTVFGIEHVTNGKLIGISILNDINMINRVAEFALYIGEDEFRGKGLSKIVTCETLRFAFHKLGLNRVFIRVLEDNKAALRLFESQGFKKEAVLRESFYKNNSFHKVLIYGILKNEFNG